MAKKKKVKEEASLSDYLNLMFGDGSAQMLDQNHDSAELPPEEFVSTGVFSIDNLLGGGFKRGVISEIYGSEGSGKTTLALQTAAIATAAGEQVIFIDCEHALNTGYVNALGIDKSKFIILAPNTGEEVFDILSKVLTKSEDFNTGLIIVDSVAAMSPEADEETSQMASHARMMSKGMRKLVKHLGGKTSIIMINQERAKVGVMFGSNKTTTGGNALKYQACVRMQLVRIGSVKSGDTVLGQRVKLSTVKNKYTSPYQNREVELVYGEGFDAVSDVIDIAISKGIIAKSGGWFSVPSEEKSIQGKVSVKQYYAEHPEHFEALKEQV